jgi:hypothetical protein
MHSADACTQRVLLRLFGVLCFYRLCFCVEKAAGPVRVAEVRDFRLVSVPSMICEGVMLWTVRHISLKELQVL